MPGCLVIGGAATRSFLGGTANGWLGGDWGALGGGVPVVGVREVGLLSVVSFLIGVAFSNLTILLLLGGGAAAGTLMVARRAALALDSGSAPRNLRMPVCCASRAMVVIALKGDVPFQLSARRQKAHLLARPAQAARARWR